MRSTIGIQLSEPQLKSFRRRRRRRPNHGRPSVDAIALHFRLQVTFLVLNTEILYLFPSQISLHRFQGCFCFVQLESACPIYAPSIPVSARRGHVTASLPSILSVPATSWPETLIVASAPMISSSSTSHSFHSVVKYGRSRSLKYLTETFLTQSKTRKKLG